MWDFLILNPMVNLLLLFYKLLGHQTVLAITALTLVVRLAVLPLTLKQQRAAQRMQELQPRLLELQKKYANDREALAREQMKLYREAGINPFGGCLPLLIQFPILIGLWQAIMRTLAATPMELVLLSQNIYSFIPDLNSLIPLQSRFLWMDLGQPDPYLVLPVLVVVTSWLSQKILTPPAADRQTALMNQQMLILMPLMFGFISLSYASGLSIYFIISNLVTILQYYLTPRPTPAAKAESAGMAKAEPVKRSPERSRQPARKREKGR
ncbi:MAG: YidC/Oxa1 family membrane protein insertase [Anaerolineae bacterium]|nr:YidC/Oxa1 family membrane protein insertase [Anaerolineae bacterium]MCX8067492.1 YidC/Oxa1 family membrane protein insertase [Anaerolineae bacterium]MDW7991639.1 YidC/Oxa1 family membrane protein insertase [Anaerolineae bacterium]